jgi:hypothetical protein
VNRNVRRKSKYFIINYRLYKLKNSKIKRLPAYTEVSAVTPIIFFLANPRTTLGSNGVME